jgi:phytoene dehydrogenase-like protein
MKDTYDALVIGSGPNGLAAAIYLQDMGLKTAVFEQASVPGGATRTEELTLPGFKHDVGSAIHPLAYASPYLKSLPLDKFGLEWIFPDIPFAHALAGGQARACYQDIHRTSEGLGADAQSYKKLMTDMVGHWDALENNLLGPLTWPEAPLKLAAFGLKALLPATWLNKLYFKEKETRAMIMGAAAHSILPLTWPATASFGLVLSVLAHKTGWPFPKGGAAAITQSMLEYYRSKGGELMTNHLVSDLKDLPPSKAILMDLTPAQILKLKNTGLTPSYQNQLKRYKYGAGICKLDWALSEPAPFLNADLRKAGTVHFGYDEEEIIESEKSVYENRFDKPPYVLFAQHSVFDPTRAPEGKHTAWAYCHVPLDSKIDASKAMEDQIEKAAPGFRKTILSRSVMTSEKMEAFNPNLVGGDINGGRQDMTQLFTRPTLSLKPYRTSNAALYICSSSTPPGGGVHGMCGYHAARLAFTDHFLV